MPTIASNATAFGNLILAFGVRDYVAATRPTGWLALPTSEARIEHDIRALNDPELIGKWLMRVELRIRADRDDTVALANLKNARRHAIETLRDVWPHLLRRTKIGVRKFLRAYFMKLRQIEKDLLWSGVENL